MNDDTNSNENADDFWGASPEWSPSPSRPRRTPSEHRNGLGGTLKGLWNTAMSAGTEPTREHRIIDATQPRPAVHDDTNPIAGDDVFDDLDTETAASRHGSPRSPMFPSGRVPVFDQAGPDDPAADDRRPRETGDVSEGTDDHIGDDVFAFAPASVSDRRDERRGVRHAVDPLLVRIGAVAIATTLIVPLAIGLSSGDDSGDSIESAAAADVSSRSISRDAAAESAAPVASTASSAPPTAPRVTAVASDGSRNGADDPGDQDDPGDETDDAVAASPTEADESDDTTADTTDENEADENEADDDLDRPVGAARDALVDSGADSDGAAGGDGPDALDAGAIADETAERSDDCAIDYEIVAGDYWVRLADAAGVSLAELLDVNGATADTALFPGMNICLPAGSSTPGNPADTPRNTTATTSPSTPTTGAPRPTEPAPTRPPTTEPPATQPPSTPAPTAASGPDDVKQIIRDVWPDDLEERAIQIADRESSFDPRAKNYCCYGVFQMYWEVHRSWLADLGITSAEQLYDPVANTRAAYALYQRAGGWGPWGF